MSLLRLIVTMPPTVRHWLLRAFGVLGVLALLLELRRRLTQKRLEQPSQLHSSSSLDEQLAQQQQ